VLSSELGYPAGGAETAARLEAFLSRPDRVVFVADAGDAVVGWIAVVDRPLLQEEAGAEIEGLVVAAGRRGQGVGAALVGRAEAWAAERGLRIVRVRSRSTRSGAHAFYRSLGYEDVKTSLVFHREL